MTTITRYDPFREALSLRNAIDQLFTQSFVSPQGKPQQQGQHQNWLLREIGTGTFERTITFPKPINTENIQTNYENGILTITVPISEERRPRRISISRGEGQPKQVTVESGR